MERKLQPILDVTLMWKQDFPSFDIFPFVLETLKYVTNFPVQTNVFLRELYSFSKRINYLHMLGFLSIFLSFTEGEEINFKGFDDAREIFESLKEDDFALAAANCNTDLNFWLKWMNRICYGQFSFKDYTKETVYGEIDSQVRETIREKKPSWKDKIK